MEQSREFRNKPTKAYLTDCWQSAKVIQWRNGSLFNRWCWNNWTSACQQMNLNLNLTPPMKINSKINRRPKSKIQHCTTSTGIHRRGTSLVVQWVRLHTPDAGGPGSIPGRETRSGMHATTGSPRAATKKSRCRSYRSCVPQLRPGATKINKFFFKGIHGRKICVILH